MRRGASRPSHDMAAAMPYTPESRSAPRDDRRPKASDEGVQPQMENLIPVINKLQDVFNAIGNDHGIDLPQICVVGAQSSGKSSVLEAIVGRDFLPRGSGIVTRRPLVLQLCNVPDNKGDKFKEWGEFLHKPTELFYDFDEIRREIERETDRISGKNKGVSSIPINLKVFSPHVLNLTLVDLPGLTRVPVGDQPLDIEHQIRKMVRQYATKKNAIILAVTPANTDLATSDSLQLAREVDPEGKRTIGVITKVDIMDKGTDALDMLLGRVFPLRLGYVGVVNRSQHDIISKKSIRSALQDEKDFFETHPLYRSISGRCGSAYLSKLMNKVLMNHIRDTLPELKSEINKMTAEANAEFMTYGDPMYDGKNSQGALLLQVVTKFSDDYRQSIDGSSTNLSTSELSGGARINYIFNEVFARCLNDLDPIALLSAHDIRTLICNATGPSAALFVPESSFQLLVKRQIMRLEEPALQCVDLVFEELQRIVGQLESKELLRFHNLRGRVVETVMELLVKCRAPCKMMIKNLINIELAYINTSNPDFIGGGGAITSVFEKMARTSMEAQQTYQTEEWSGAEASMANAAGQPHPPGVDPRGAPPPSDPRRGGRPPPGNHAPPSRPDAPPGAEGAPEGGFFNMFFGGKGGGGPEGHPPEGARRGTKTKKRTVRRKKKVPAAAEDPIGAMGVQHTGMGEGRHDPRMGAHADPRSRDPRMASQHSSSSRSSSHRRTAGGSTVLERVPTTIRASATPTDKEAFETELIQQLLISYFDIVRKNVRDMVPKSVMYFLVNQSKNTVQNELVAQLYKEDLFEELLEESSSVAQRRNACKTMLDVLRRAQDILNEVRDTPI